MKTKNLLLTSAIFFTTSIFADVVVIDRDHLNTLPLNITDREQFCYYSRPNDYKFLWTTYNGEGIARILVNSDGTLNFSKPNFTTNKGESTGIIHFNSVPGFLTLKVSVGEDNACTSSDHNKLYVYSSVDGVNFTEHGVINNQGGEFKYKLNNTDRYIKFRYTNTSGYCGHKYNPVKITLPNVLTKKCDSFELSGNSTSIISDTLFVDYSNPAGNLSINADNENISFEKITNEEVGNEGTVMFLVNYAANNPGEYNGTITVKDLGQEEVSIDIPYVINSTIAFYPESPIVKLDTKTLETISCSWNEVERAIEYNITVSNGEAIIANETINTTSYKLNDLVRGEEYLIEVVAVADNGNISEQAAKLSIKLADDFGAQIANVGFENWEDVPGFGKEPKNWNSFGNAKASGMLAAAKAEQVKPSDLVRPGSKGVTSASIYSKYVKIVTIEAYANGNLTTGQIVAGSTTPTNLANYNALVFDNPDFCQSIDNVLPDSLSVWVNYVPAKDKEGMSARVSFVAHTEKEAVKDPSASESVNTIAKAEDNYSISRQWTRLSVPFIMNKDFDDSQAVNKIYILGTFTTNSVAGVATDESGAVPDSVYIDDLLFIYNPTVAINALSNNILEEGESFNIDFNLNGTMSASNINEERNQVTVELSDINGSFENPITISATPKLTDESGIITAVLPDQLHSGIYKVRVSTSNYPMKSEPVEIEVKGSLVTSIDEDTMNNINISLYPNPAKNIINVLGASGMDYRIYNVNGSLIVKGCMIESSINISNLTEGIYFIEFISESGKSVIKFIKE